MKHRWKFADHDHIAQESARVTKALSMSRGEEKNKFRFVTINK